MQLIDRLSNFLAGRWYALYVSGHGSKYRRESELLTKRRALLEADRWEGDACTIGGRSMAANIFTGRIIYPKYLANSTIHKVGLD